MTMTQPMAPTPNTLPPAVPILANPFSGSGPNRKRVDALVAALDEVGLASRLVWERDERAELLADPTLADWCRCVVAAGGDGSVADVINDMSPGGVTPAVPFATLPMGTENLFARQLGFDAGPKAIAAAIARGQTSAIDVGLVGDGHEPRLFTLMASAGFDADVVYRVDRWRKREDHLKRVNRASYAPKILGSLMNYGYPPVTLEADGQRVTGAHVFVFNIPQYGGNLGIGKHADPADGRLDWVVFEKRGMLRMLGYGLSVARMRHLDRDDIHHGTATRVTITADQPVPLQADGDPAGYTPGKVEVRPGAVNVIKMAE